MTWISILGPRYSVICLNNVYEVAAERGEGPILLSPSVLA